MANTSLVVMRKEFLDALRDRKALTTILAVPVLNVVIVFAVIQFMAFMQDNSRDFELPVQGMEQGQPIVNWLREQNINIVEAPENAVEQVKAKELDFVLIIPPDFPEQFADMERTPVELVYDASRNDVRGQVFTIKREVRQWSATVGAQRLLIRGVSPRLMNPVNVQDVDVAEEETGSAMIFGLVALILTLTIFTTTTGISIDMMAGEREKNSLEPLLLSPASRLAIVGGKWATAMAFTLGVMLMVIVALYFMLPHLPLAQLGVRSHMSLANVAGLVLVALPLIMIATMFQLFVAIFSKSFKEAQSYIGLLMIIPIFVGYYVVWSDVSHFWQYWVPVMSTQMLMEDILGTGYSLTLNYLASVSASVGLALLLAGVTVFQLRRERIIYG